MNIHEYQAKALLKGFGAPVADGVAIYIAPDDMTALAIRGSRFHNAVSRIHRDVTAEMLGELWSQVPLDEKPVGYITNGVHTSSFLSSQMKALFGTRWLWVILALIFFSLVIWFGGPYVSIADYTPLGSELAYRPDRDPPR